MNFEFVAKGKVVIVGIGNPLRGDDGFGPAFIEDLRGRVSALCIDGGSAPENYIGKIIKEEPDTILIVDAVHLDLAPGEYRLLEKEDILECGFTTHDLSPHMFIDFLEKETKADIYLLGVQPKSLSFGDQMSEPVKRALQELIGLLKGQGSGVKGREKKE